jgi:SAM-dependent methyltransferase
LASAAIGPTRPHRDQAAVVDRAGLRPNWGSQMLRPMVGEKRYFLGNAAKSRIVASILARARTAPSGEGILVFDHGCGGGGDWPGILADNPGLSYVGYDPDPVSLRRAQERLQGRRARLLTAEELAGESLRADVVVSFSVFEHVYDRLAYLRLSARHLAPGGTFFLNYDDGHFRTPLDLDRPALWGRQLRPWIHNLLARPLAALGAISRFQARVARSDADRLVADAGFEAVDEFYSNIESFKTLSKTLPAQAREDFMQFWLGVEEALNARFRMSTGIQAMGDETNLWRTLPSRTLVLRAR